MIVKITSWTRFSALGGSPRGGSGWIFACIESQSDHSQWIDFRRSACIPKILLFVPPKNSLKMNFFVKKIDTRRKLVLFTLENYIIILWMNCKCRKYHKIVIPIQTSKPWNRPDIQVTLSVQLNASWMIIKPFFSLVEKKRNHSYDVYICIIFWIIFNSAGIIVVMSIVVICLGKFIQSFNQLLFHPLCFNSLLQF